METPNNINVSTNIQLSLPMNPWVKLKKLHYEQSICCMSVNTTQLNIISSLESLVLWFSCMV